MKRLCSQLLFCTPNDIRRNYMLELNDESRVTQMQDISKLQTETAQTVFHNGIISASIISLQNRLDIKEISQNNDTYIYINIKTDFTIPNLNSDNRILIIDAETEDPQAFSRLLQCNYEKIKHISLFEIIAASTYNPALAIGIKNEISIHATIKPILWQHCNLVAKLLNKNSEAIHI